jgi:glycosidase
MDQRDARPDWVSDAVFYQIFPDRFANGDPANDPPGVEPWGGSPTPHNFFGGDLAGVQQRLPYLAELGITALYLTPVFAAGTNHRYDTHDYLSVDPALGDTDRLRELVAQAHGLGMRVILDGVFNHCGDGFWAFQDVAQRGLESPYRDWFFIHGVPVRRDPPSYQTCGGAPYLPKLNVANPEVRRYLLHVARYWIETADIDGWRLDVPWKVAPDFWQDLRAVVKSVKPDAYLAGECWRDARPWLTVFDGVMNYRLRDILLDFCVRDHMDAEDAAYETQRMFADYGPSMPYLLNLLGSHDTPRLLSLCQGDSRRAIVALTALFTWPGAPMLYYGDEIGMEGANDPDCRRCMRWDPSDWRMEIVQACRTLIALRRTHLALRHGTWEPLLIFNGVLAYRRRCAHDDAVIVLNPRDAQPELTIEVPGGKDCHWRDPLNGGAYRSRQGRLCLGRVPATTAMILIPQEHADAHDQ